MLNYALNVLAQRTVYEVVILCLTFFPNVLPCLEWLARHFPRCILRQCGLCLVFDNKRFSFLLGSVLTPHGLRLSLLDDALIYGLLRVVLTPYYFTSFQGLTAGNYTPLSKWFFGVFSPRPLSVLSLFFEAGNGSKVHAPKICNTAWRCNDHLFVGSRDSHTAVGCLFNSRCHCFFYSSCR